jgi:hypothetical protein
VVGKSLANKKTEEGEILLNKNDNIGVGEVNDKGERRI